MGISWLCEHWESLCGNLMRRVRSPAFVHRADLYHGFASPSHRGEPPTRSLRRVSVSRLKVERRRREWSMVGTPTSIYCCEESLPIRGDPARYFVRPTRTRWRRNNRSPTLPAEYLLGRVRAIRTFSGSHWTVRCRQTAFRSSCSHFPHVRMV